MMLDSPLRWYSGAVNGTVGAMFKAWFREEQKKYTLLIK